MTSTYVRRFTVGLGLFFACFESSLFIASVSGQSPSLSEEKREEIKSTAEQLAGRSAESQRDWLTQWVGGRYTEQVQGEFAASEWSQVERPVRLAFYELEHGKPLPAEDLYTLMEHVERSAEQALLRGARRFRIELYQRYRMDREQYDERIRQWEDVEAVWLTKPHDPAWRQELLSWLVSARRELETLPTELPFGIEFGNELVAAATLPSPDNGAAPRPPVDQFPGQFDTYSEPSVASSPFEGTIPDFPAAAERHDPIVNEPAVAEDSADEGHVGGGSWLRSILGGSGLLGQKGSSGVDESTNGFSGGEPRDRFEEEVLSLPSQGSEPASAGVIEETAQSHVTNPDDDTLADETATIEVDFGGLADDGPAEVPAHQTTDAAADLANAINNAPAAEEDQLRGYFRGMAAASDQDALSTEESVENETSQGDSTQEVVSSSPEIGADVQAEEEFEQLSDAVDAAIENDPLSERLSTAPTTPAVREARFDGESSPDATGGVNVQQLKARIAGFNRALDGLEQKLEDADRAWSFDELNDALKELADLSWRSRDLKLYWTLLPSGERSRLSAPEGIERSLDLLGERIEESISSAAEGSAEADRLQRLRKRMDLLNQDAV